MKFTAPKCWWVMATLVLAAVTSAFAQQTTATGTVNTTSNVVDIIGEGKVDWSKDELRARGIGFAPKNARTPALASAMAREAAIVAAERNLLKVIKGVHVSSETTVENLVITQDTIKTKVEGLLLGATIVSEKAIGTDGYEVVMSVHLFGEESSLAQSINLADQFKAVTPEIVIAPVAQPEPPKPVVTPEPETHEVVAPVQAATDGYTGLVVDCRGIGLTRSMCPRLLDQNNTNIWSTLTVSAELVNERGVAGYFQSSNDPALIARVGKHPLTIKPLRAGGGKTFKTDAILSPADAELVRTENTKTLFLEKLNVAFLID